MKNQRKQLVTLTLAVLTITAAGRINAQTSLGAILGNVRDSTGAFIQGAHIEVKNENNGFIRTTATDDRGFYLVDRIDPNSYTVTAEVNGFKAIERMHIAVDAGSQVRVDVGMEVGSLTDKITVTAPSPVIETETARIATVLTRENQLSNALNNTGPFNLMMMAPAVFYTGAGYSANGSRATDEWLTIGGIYIGSPTNGVQNSSLGLRDEATQEVLVSSVNNPAEYGSSTVMNQIPVSGTNHFHGDVQYRNTNSALNARTFFAKTKPVSKTVEYLGSIGGPVLLPGYNGRNRTFFFFSVYQNISPNFVSNLLNVPTPAMRQGDFSAITTTIKDPSTGAAFQGNKIPASQLNPVAVAYLNKFYPSPNAGNGVLPVANFTDNVENGGKAREYTLRVDQSLGSRSTLTYSMFKHFDGNAKVDDSLPSQYLGIPVNANYTQSHSLANTFTISPTKVNEFRAGFGRKNSPAVAAVLGLPIVTALGLVGYPSALSSTASGIPAVTISGLQGINTTQENISINNWLDINDNFTFIKGSHAFKTGVSYFWSLVDASPASPSAQFGTFAFDGFATGQAFSDFLLGVPHTASRASEVSPYYGRRKSVAAYFQDDWKVLPNLTLNFGIRYEVAPPYSEQNDRIVSFDPKTGTMVVPAQQTISQFNSLFPTSVPVSTAAQAGFPSRSLIATDWLNFAPRVGFAWRTGVAGIVVRSGYGIFYDSVARNPFTGLTAGPFTATSTYDNTVTAGKPRFAWPLAFPTGVGANALGIQDINAASVNLPDAYTQQWSFSLDKQIGVNGLRLSYIGSESTDLLYRRNLNQPAAGTTPFVQSLRPYPSLRNITYTDSGGTQSYQSLQAQFVRHLSRGILTDAAFTWAKDLSDVQDSNAQGAAIPNSYNLRSERGNVEFMPRLRFINNYVWELPFGKGRPFLGNAPGVVDAVIGGWTTSGTLILSSGGWATPFITGVDPSNTNTTTLRPNRIANGNLPADQRTLNLWYDTTAFAVPSSGQFGNSGIGIIQGPGTIAWSARVFKVFTLHEQVRLRVDALFDNALNHPNFGFAMYQADSGLNVATAAKGRITTTNNTQSGANFDASRQIKLCVRLEF